MSQLGLVEVDPTSVPTPPAGAKTIFVDNTSHVVSVKDESGTISPLGGASGLAVGGVLTGTLPNPGLAATTVVAAAYGSANTITTLTVGVDGRLTAAAGVAVAITETNLTLSDVTTDNVSITKHGFAPKAPNDATKVLLGDGTYGAPPAGAPSGTAGGDLTGTYPNPTLRDSTALTVIGRSANSTGHPADIATSADGDVLRRSGTTLGFGTITGTSIASSVALAGSPTTTTQTAGDNSTKLATTAYADNAVAKQAEVFMVAISDESTALTTGTAKVTFRMPFACSMTAVPRANVNTVSSSGLPTFDIKKNGTTIFSTTLTIDASEKTSVTAATAAVLTSSPTTFSDDDEITIDISTAGAGTKGAKITLNVVRT